MSERDRLGLHLSPMLKPELRLSPRMIISPPIALSQESMFKHAVHSTGITKPREELLDSLAELICSEDSGNPLTDSMLAAALNSEFKANEQFSAKDIASLRRHLNIPPSRERKES